MHWLGRIARRDPNVFVLLQLISDESTVKGEKGAERRRRIYPSEEDRFAAEEVGARKTKKARLLPMRPAKSTTVPRTSSATRLARAPSRLRSLGRPAY
jgi:hypothetical protein